MFGDPGMTEPSEGPVGKGAEDALNRGYDLFRDVVFEIELGSAGKSRGRFDLLT